MFVGKSWNANTKKLFYDSNSKRGGVLMHAKVSWMRADMLRWHICQS